MRQWEKKSETIVKEIIFRIMCMVIKLPTRPHTIRLPIHFFANIVGLHFQTLFNDTFYA